MDYIRIDFDDKPYSLPADPADPALFSSVTVSRADGRGGGHDYS